MEIPEIYLCVYGVYGQMIFVSGAKIIQQGKDSLANKMVLGKLKIHIKKSENRSVSYPIHKSNTKWIKDIKHKTLRYNRRKHREKLPEIGHWNNFVYDSRKAQIKKAKIN